MDGSEDELVEIENQGNMYGMTVGRERVETENARFLIVPPSNYQFFS